MAKTHTLRAGPVETATVAPWGDFQLIRPFVLRGPPTDGFIIQQINRKIDVLVDNAAKDRLTTTAQISSFTSRNVENAADSYYELFIVEGGVVLDRDQFQGGQVLRYVATGADDRIKTSGTIEITGTSVFVPGDISEAKAAMHATERVATRRATRFTALGHTWDAFIGGPANGLPFLTIDAKLPLEKMAVSNVLIRKCTITWTVDGRTVMNEVTNPMSPFPTVRTGGRRSTRVRTASRLSRKRRTGRATRRSRRRA